MIIITKIDNYKEINKNLLDLIGKIPKNPLKNDGEEDISNTDWNIPQSTKREYLEYFYKVISPHMDKLAIALKSKNWLINNGWFQQYEQSKSHSWHTHAKTNFTNVYFIELPNKSLGTEILNHEKLDLNEGDLLTFPGYLYHRSPVNLTNERKTIISFNSDFYDYLG